MKWCNPAFANEACYQWQCKKCKQSLAFHDIYLLAIKLCDTFVFGNNDHCTLECQIAYKIKEATSSRLWLAVFQ